MSLARRRSKPPTNVVLSTLARWWSFRKPRFLLALLLLLVGFPLLRVVRSISDSTEPFTLVVTLDFVDDRSKQAFLRDIAPEAAFVEAQEPQTLSYKVLQSDSDPLRLLIIERYATKDAYLQTHKSSSTFQAFRPKLQQLQDAKRVVVSGGGYIDTPAGFFLRRRQSDASS